MIELPEAITMAKNLNSSIKGRRITEVIAAQNHHGFAWYFGDPAGYEDLLVDRIMESASCFGGFVELNIGDSKLTFQDGANVRLLPKGAKPPEKHQLYLKFDDGTSIVTTIQMYAAIMAFPASLDYDNSYYLTAKASISPLDKKFDEIFFGKLVSDAPPKLSVKGLLATEQRIPGLGNGCLQDILWNAEINPKSKVHSLSDTELETLFKSVKSTLKDMTDNGGRNTEKNLFGEAGGYQSILSAKTKDYPCIRCGGVITKKAYMGGNVYYCEKCQKVSE